MLKDSGQKLMGKPIYWDDSLIESVTVHLSSYIPWRYEFDAFHITAEGEYKNADRATEERGNSDAN